MQEIDYISVCSGIEAATVAWETLGFKASAFAEIDNFPAAVLAHRWPKIPNVRDMLKIPTYLRCGLLPAPSVLVGGTPCQSYSVAGKRTGLDDPRGQLTLAYVDILNTIDELRGFDNECVCVWENVPGVLSDKGNAFGEFLGKLAGESEPLQPTGGKWSNAGCVFGPQRTIAWRVLDAQYFGVAQRRRRIFVVASARQGFDPCAVLFEFEGVRRDTSPSRAPGQDIASTITASLGNRSGTPGCASDVGFLQPVICMAHGQGGAEISVDKAPALTCNHKAPIAVYASEICPTLNAGGNTTGGHRPPGSTVDTVDSLIVVHGTQDPCTSTELDFALGRNNGAENAICYGIPGNHIGRAPENGGNATQPMYDIAPCLTKVDRHAVAYGMQVRRLMPSECAKLQGFAKDHCKIPYRGNSADVCPDGPQYKAFGNSMAVPCMRFIGVRLCKELST